MQNTVSQNALCTPALLDAVARPASGGLGAPPRPVAGQPPCHRNSSCLSPSPTRSRRYRWAFCRRDGMRKKKTQNANNAGDAAHARQRPAGSRGCQRRGRVPRRMSPAGGRATFDLRFLLNLYCFRSAVRPKNRKSNRHKSGLSVVKLPSAP